VILQLKLEQNEKDRDIEVLAGRIELERNRLVEEIYFIISVERTNVIESFNLLDQVWPRVGLGQKFSDSGGWVG
jgi:hypothetical protein